jgi:hypothetical protein
LSVDASVSAWPLPAEIDIRFADTETEPARRAPFLHSHQLLAARGKPKSSWMAAKSSSSPGLHWRRQRPQGSGTSGPQPRSREWTRRASFDMKRLARRPGSGGFLEVFVLSDKM